MSRLDIKTEIQKLLDEVPENALEEVLSYLNMMKDVTPEILRNSKNLNKVLTEDKELLKKLAS